MQAANERGWTTKSWITRKGHQTPGRRFSTLYVRALLTKLAYVGKLRFDGETFQAEQPALVSQDTFDRVQALMAENGTTGGRLVRNKHHALLAGLLRCEPCGAPMLPTFTKHRGRLYRYYVCRKTRKEGWNACPSKSVPAREIEGLVVEQIRAVGKDPAVQAATLKAVREPAAGVDVEADDLRRALSLWDDVWAALVPKEQARLIGLLLERVSYDGVAGTAALSFRATGIQALSGEVGP